MATSDWMTTRVSQLRIAVATLTRLPVGRIPEPVPNMASGRWAYPLVGAGVGAIIGVAVVLGSWLGLSDLLSAILGVVVGLFVTGALNEDGLADCADGFWGGQDRSRKLEIMRDSHIGTYGTLALIVSIGLRSVAIAGLSTVMLSMIAVSAVSRFSMVVALEKLPAARDEGLGTSAAKGQSQVLLAGCLSAVPLVALLLATGAGVTLGVLIAMGVVGTGAAMLAVRHVGGQTGDVLGAVQQATEIAGLVVLSAMAV